MTNEKRWRIRRRKFKHFKFVSGVHVKLGLVFLFSYPFVVSDEGRTELLRIGAMLFEGARCT